MNDTNDLLFELGTEELPPKQLKKLATALAGHIQTGIEQAELGYESVNWFATPRRLAVLVQGLQTHQTSSEQQRRGPALAAAYDDAGNPSKAALGFAKSCNTTVEQLQSLKTEKGEWLSYTLHVAGKPARELLPAIITTALQRLPIAKRMRWGEQQAEFVRPVHWAVLLLGDTTLAMDILGVQSANQSYGHRFHAPQAITIDQPGDYPVKLQQAYVEVDYARRQQNIRAAIEREAEQLQARPLIDPDLLDEVTAITEWPVPVVGEFDPAFLQLPKEVLIASMQDHQKYFPLLDHEGGLKPNFITFANIDSSKPEAVRKGNERVLSPRLNDARFFWQQDSKLPLADYRPRLDDLLYQQQLGSMAAKTRRVRTLAETIAGRLGSGIEHIGRAAELAKCDLLTDMVGEFPELQGVIGYYYALESDEDKQVAIAIKEQYQPRYSGDALPISETGQILSLAEKIETIVGIFSIGQIPSGDKDPFALKRAALGALRIMIEAQLDLDLQELIATATGQYSHSFDLAECASRVFDFMMERLRGYYQEQAIDTLTFESVLARRPANPLDFHRRIEAVQAFQQLAESADLAAANKRIANILKKYDQPLPEDLDKGLLLEPAEQQLAAALTTMQQRLQPLFATNDYTAALSELASLRDDIDGFFDQVMVMSDDAKLKANRLCLLQSVQELFLATADISRLQAA